MLAVNGHAKHRQSLCRVGYGKTALSMDLFFITTANILSTHTFLLLSLVLSIDRRVLYPQKTPEPSHMPTKEINEILQRPAYLPNNTRQHKPRHYTPHKHNKESATLKEDSAYRFSIKSRSLTSPCQR